MKKKILASMLVILMSYGSLAHAATEDTHWVTKELTEYKQYIVPYRDSASTSTLGAISQKEWDSFQKNVLDASKLNNPILIDDWATALKMALSLPEKDSEAWINGYTHGLTQGTEITRESAVGGMVKLLSGSYMKGNGTGNELKSAKELLDYQDINDMHKGLVETAFRQGILDASVLDKFRPKDKLTNAEAISMMYRVMEKFVYHTPILPANHWFTEELTSSYQSGMLPESMRKVLGRTFQDPMNADRNIPVSLWHELLLSGLPVPAYIRDKAYMYTLAFNQDGGILRDRAVVGITKLGKNTRSATSEEKINAAKAFSDYHDAFDPDKIAVAYGDGLLEGKNGQSFGDHNYLTYAEAAALAVRASMREALNDKPLLLDEAAALQAAKKMDPDTEAKWKVTFKKSLVLHLNTNRQIFDGWVVEAVYPGGNKMVVYLDARTGKIMVVSEIEAPFDGIE